MSDTTTKDGTGAPIDPTAYYYIQNKRSYVGNSVVWWRAGGAGYTCELDDAGVYRGDDLPGSEDHGEVYWPVALVRQCVVGHVDMQLLRRAAETSSETSA
jgi:hypothetical protein